VQMGLALRNQMMLVLLIPHRVPPPLPLLSRPATTALQLLVLRFPENDKVAVRRSEGETTGRRANQRAINSAQAA
jgi:hypothetical protein